MGRVEQTELLFGHGMLVAGETLAGCPGVGMIFVAETALLACSTFWSSETHRPFSQMRSPLHCMSYWHPSALAWGANPTAVDMTRSMPSAFILTLPHCVLNLAGDPRTAHVGLMAASCPHSRPQILMVTEQAWSLG